MIFDGYLLVSDLDHTLVEKGQVAQRSLDAIKYFTDNGGKFTVATGRHKLTARRFYDDTGSNCPPIVCGSLVYDIENNKSVWHGPIKDTTKQICVDLFHEFNQASVLIYTLDEMICVREGPAFDHFAGVVGRNLVRFAKLEDIMDEEWVKVIFADLDGERTLGMEKTCDARNYPDFQGVRSEFYLYEINSGEQFSKGTALMYLAKYLGIDEDKTCAIGDFYNDVPMLRAAGISATVADAYDDIKELVDFVGGRCLDGAVADFIEYIENTVKEK